VLSEKVKQKIEQQKRVAISPDEPNKILVGDMTGGVLLTDKDITIFNTGFSNPSDRVSLVLSSKKRQVNALGKIQSPSGFSTGIMDVSNPVLEWMKFIPSTIFTPFSHSFPDMMKMLRFGFGIAKIVKTISMFL